MNTKREEALSLAENLLSDIELKRLEPIDIARKASRLARITDDIEAMKWLHYEVSGYPEGVDGLDLDSWTSAQKSNRVYVSESKQHARTSTIGQLQVSIESASAQLKTPGNNIYQQQALRKEINICQGVLDRVIGSIHTFISGKYQELRFGAAIETIFESIRTRVDANIAKLIPDALPILSTALENIDGDNPIQWNNAAKACRDLIKATADALRKPGKPKNGISMTDANFINRLVDWVSTNSNSKTMTDVISSDLADIGNRLDAVNDGGNKGTHSQVTRQQASRFIIGTYMLLGDILDIKNVTLITNQTNPPIDDTIADSALSTSTPSKSNKN